MINALVLAGSSNREELEQQENVDNKALLEINGAPMIVHVLSVLEETPSISEIALITSSSQVRNIEAGGKKLDEKYRIIEEQGSLLENLEAGLRQMPQEEPCLVVTSDIPLMHTGAVEDFIRRCDTLEKDFYYPIIFKEDCEKAYPGVKRTYLKIKDGSFTGGNLTLVKPSGILKNIDRLHLVFSYRKKPWKYARLLSPLLILKFLFKKVSIKELEEYIEHLLSLQARAVPTPYAEIGTDVDKPDDLEMVRKILGSSTV